MKKAGQINKSAAVILWFITIGYMGLIFYLSSQSQLLPPLIHGTDKIIHTIVYFMLAILLYFSFLKSGLRKHILLISLVFAVIYGVSDEIHQYYVPGRIASIGDVVADSLGALIGSFLAAKLNR
ncbi:MAG: VanZ family protein [Nitrospirota bacterium]